MKTIISAILITFSSFAFATDVDVAMYDEAYMVDSINSMTATAAGKPEEKPAETKVMHTDC